MNTTFRKSFKRDLKRLEKNQEILDRIRNKIEEVESTQSLDALSGLKKLSGNDIFYRIRVGDYRVGIAVENEVVTFIRCLHRREIYRYFP